MFGIEFLLFFVIILFALYKWSTKTYKTFEERGVPFEKPIPLLGNSLPLAKNQQSLHKTMLQLYQRHKQHKICGFYNFRSPFFIINDPYLIKQIAVKDFDVFTNHQSFFNTDDPLMNGMLTVMKDQRWRNMRNAISPVFTSSKMRAMFILMNECFEETIKYLHKRANNASSFDLEVKECFARLSNDLIATTAFGLKVNSYENVNNEFYAIGQDISKARGKQAIKFTLISIAPKICQWLGIKLFEQSKTDYFVNLVVEAMQYREQHNIVRPDMIQLLMEAKQESKENWSKEDLVAQCFIFFFAAFENNANLLALTCYELMENPDVQEKLYEEILQTKNKLNGQTLDYDTLQHMKYMEMVVNESLRKWPIASLTDRVCSRNYTVLDENGDKVCELKPKDNVWFQIFGLQRDPEYFENPDKFEPERFSEENKHKIIPFTYIPFGVGPRICIGNRYALMQAKAMLYYLLLEYRLERSEKSCENILDTSRGFQIDPKDGIWLKLSKR